MKWSIGWRRKWDICLISLQNPNLERSPKNQKAGHFTSPDGLNSSYLRRESWQPFKSPKVLNSFPCSLQEIKLTFMPRNQKWEGERTINISPPNEIERCHLLVNSSAFIAITRISDADQHPSKGYYDSDGTKGLSCGGRFRCLAGHAMLTFLQQAETLFTILVCVGGWNFQDPWHPCADPPSHFDVESMERQVHNASD